MQKRYEQKLKVMEEVTSSEKEDNLDCKKLSSGEETTISGDEVRDSPDKAPEKAVGEETTISAAKEALQLDGDHK